MFSIGAPEYHVYSFMLTVDLLSLDQCLFVVIPSDDVIESEEKHMLHNNLQGYMDV